MRPMMTIVSVAAILTGGAAQAAEPTVEAKLALTNLQQLAVKRVANPELEMKKLEGLKRLGFSSKTELLGAQLAAPVRVFMIRLDALRSYRPGADSPARLLRAIDEQIYPVQVEQRTKSAVFIDRGRLSGYGSPRLASRIEQVRMELQKQTGLPETAFFLVKLPALNVRFLGHYQKRHDVRRLDAVEIRSAVGRSYSVSPLLSKSVAPSKQLQLTPKLTSTKQLMLTPLQQVKLPAGGRDSRYVTLAFGKTLDADRAFRALLAPARNLDVSVPH
jgi:hypothetical protein